MQKPPTGRLIKGLLTCVMLITAFYLGAVTGQPAGKAQTPSIINAEVNTGFRPVVESKVIESTRTVIVEKPVKVIEYIEKSGKSPAGLSEFGSLSRLEQWLAEMEAGSNGAYFSSPGGVIDCDDYALRLQQIAVSDGYLMNLQIIETGRYNALFTKSRLPPDSFHAINLAVIGNDAYYIEPQTLEVVLGASLD
jgi:hypothetical protein